MVVGEVAICTYLVWQAAAGRHRGSRNCSVQSDTSYVMTILGAQQDAVCPLMIDISSSTDHQQTTTKEEGFLSTTAKKTHKKRISPADAALNSSLLVPISVETSSY